MIEYFSGRFRCWCNVINQCRPMASEWYYVEARRPATNIFSHDKCFCTFALAKISLRTLDLIVLFLFLLILLLVFFYHFYFSVRIFAVLFFSTKTFFLSRRANRSLILRKARNSFRSFGGDEH